MEFEIDNHSGVPVYRQIMNQIRRQILSNQIREGEAIPSVRELAKTIKVNPMTVSKSYSFLEMENLIDRQRGKGLFAAAIPDDIKREKKLELLKTSCQQFVQQSIQMNVNLDEAMDMLKKTYEQSPQGRGK